MIESITTINFQDAVQCSSTLFQSKESFLPISYEFKKGNSYGLISDFGCGSWGVVTSLRGYCSENYTGQILANHSLIHGKSLAEHACFLADSIFPGVNSPDKLLTPRECIKKALEQSLQPYSVEKIKKIFCLSDSRFERPLDQVSGEIWFVSVAVNFALGKEIFCFPWLNMLEIRWFKSALENGVIDFLKKKGKIILIPSSQRHTLHKYCDHTILFKKDKIVYR